jgi:hypothetical protein
MLLLDDIIKIPPYTILGCRSKKVLINRTANTAERHYAAGIEYLPNDG